MSVPSPPSGPDDAALLRESPLDSDATSSTVASGARAMATAQVTTQLTRFATNIVLARLLAPHDFGVMAVAAVVIVFFDQIRDMGTGSAIIQRRELPQSVIGAVFSLNVLVGLVLTVCLALLAPYIGVALGQPDADSVLLALAPLALIASLGQVHHALLRRDLHFRAMALITAEAAAATAIVSIVAAAFGAGVWALVVGTATGTVIETGLSWHFDQWRPSRATGIFDLKSLRAIWRYSSNLFLANLLQFFFNQSDKVLVSRALGATPLGVYSMVQRILTYPISSVSNVIGEVTFPAFSRKQNDTKSLCDGYIRASAAIALVACPLMAGVAAIATPAVDSVLGLRWHALIPLVWILGPVGAVQAVTYPALQLVMAKGRSDIYFRWMIFSSAVTIAAYVVGLHWGLVGICAGYAISVAALTPILLVICFRQVGLPFTRYLRGVAPYFLMSIAMASIVLLVDLYVVAGLSEWLILLVGSLVGVLVYASGLAIIRPPALSDLFLALRHKNSTAVR
jgi:lipopolysaccharide exporter